MMPWRPKLIIAGQQSTIPEAEGLWHAKNCSVDLDGMLCKRPGITKWGQTIKVPDPDADSGTSTLTFFVDFLSGIANFKITDNSVGTISTSTALGTLTTSVTTGTTENYILSYLVSLSSNTEWSTRFLFRGVDLPVHSDTTTADTFSIKIKGATGSGKEFAIWNDGIYYKRTSDNKYTKIAGSDIIGSGGWHIVEIQCTIGGNTLVYLDDILLETILSTLLATASFTEANAAIEMKWLVEDETNPADEAPYTTYISTLMYNDVSTSPFIAVPIVALNDFQYLTSSGGKIRTLLAAAGDYIYCDKNLQGAWRPLHAKQHAYVWFAPYRSTIVWTDNTGGSTSKVYQWDGVNDPELLDDAPPVRFVTEHQQRLLGWGDILNPRRLYYSGDRRPNVWFSPTPDNTEDEFDTLLDAGYQEIQSFGVEIKAVVGDYYGTAIVAGDKGFWKLSGSGPFSYRLDGIKVGAGAASANAMIQIGNDVWSIAKQGIASLATTDQFGDIQANFPSIPIQTLWSVSENSPYNINETFIDKTKLVYNARQATVYIAVPLTSDQDTNKIFIYNVNTQGFYGPWEVDTQAIATVEVASPITEVTMLGNSDGNIGYFNKFVKTDFGIEYNMEIETPAYNGRSIDPVLIGLQKTWRTLRLFIVTEGAWDFTVNWWTDENPQTYTRTQAQNTIKCYTLDKDFRLDLDPDGLLASGNEMSVIDIPLNARGRNLVISIVQPGTEGESFAIQGMKIELLPNKNEGE